MTAKTRILVVIPTLNEAANIERVLHELSAAPPADAEILYVVADGGSSDATGVIVDRIGTARDDVRLIHNMQRLQSAAVNLAVDQLGDTRNVLIRCDAHAEYPEGFIASLLESLGSSDADAVVVPMDSVGSSCFQKAVGWVSDSKVGSGGSAHRGGARSGFVDHGHHAVFRLESFRRAGGYDPTFSHNEDAELDCRQRALGSRIFLDATIRLRYSPRDTPGKLARQYFHYGKGRSRTVRRHPTSLRLRQLAIPCFVAMTCATWLLALTTPWVLAWTALYLAVLITNAVSLTVRHRSPCALLAAPAAAIMHFAWGAGFLWGLARVRETRWFKP